MIPKSERVSKGPSTIAPLETKWFIHYHVLDNKEKSWNWLEEVYRHLWDAPEILTVTMTSSYQKSVLAGRKDKVQ